MATLTVDFFTSLDGNGSAHGWPGDWGKEGPELRDYLVQTVAQQAVLGRVGGEPPGVPIGAGRCAIPHICTPIIPISRERSTEPGRRLGTERLPSRPCIPSGGEPVAAPGPPGSGCGDRLGSQIQ